MTWVAAAELGQKGFNGALAVIVEETDTYWGDLDRRWYMGAQYFKSYPVCFWAQAPLEGARSLMQRHGFCAKSIRQIEVDTFHDAASLATNSPKTTARAQYSTSFPVAVALARGNIGAYGASEEALQDPEILRLSNSLVMTENKDANKVFPI